MLLTSPRDDERFPTIQAHSPSRQREGDGELRAVDPSGLPRLCDGTAFIASRMKVSDNKLNLTEMPNFCAQVELTLARSGRPSTSGTETVDALTLGRLQDYFGV